MADTLKEWHHRHPDVDQSIIELESNTKVKEGHRNHIPARQTPELVQIFDSPRRFERISTELIPLQCTIFTELFHANSEFVECIDSVQSRKTCSPCVLGVFRTGQRQEVQVPGQKVS